MIITSVTTNLALVALVITNSFKPHMLREFDGLYYRHSTTNLIKVIDDTTKCIYGHKYECDWCNRINTIDLHQLMNSKIHSLYLSFPCPKCSKRK